MMEVSPASAKEYGHGIDISPRISHSVPLPLAQLYNRAHNAKDPRNRHDNAYYLFEALVKLMAAPLVAAYLHEMRHGGKRVDVIDWRLQQLALPSLGQWVGIVRALAKHFGTQAETPSHPLAHLWGQLTRQHRDKPGLVGLYHSPIGLRELVYSSRYRRVLCFL